MAETRRGRGKAVTSTCHAAHYARARTAAAPKKARPRCKNRSLDCEALNDRVPCQASRTLERDEPPARDTGNPRWDIDVRRYQGPA
jgi:hypothetical protein